MTDMGGDPTTTVTSSLSDDQRAEIKAIVTASNEFVFIEKHSNEVLRRVRRFIFPAIGAFIAFLAWLGWDSYTSIEREVALQVDEQVDLQVEQFIQSRANEITAEVRSLAEVAASAVVDDEIARITAETLRPQLNQQVNSFQEQVEQMRTEAISSVQDEFTSAFPILSALEELGADGITELERTVEEISDERRRLAVEFASRGELLDALSDQLAGARGTIVQQGEDIEQLSSDVLSASTEIEALSNSILSLRDTISATREICALFQVIPADRFVFVFGEPVPDDDPELPFRIEVAIDTIVQTCQSL